MQTIVITGSTRGIGRGLAEAFLARGNDNTGGLRLLKLSLLPLDH